MKPGYGPMIWKAPVLGALAAVLAFASPAAAAEPTSTTVQASPPSVVIGRSVQLVAQVSCPSDPSGGLGVTFFDGGDILATAPVSSSGQSSITSALTVLGAHTITAAYNGNDNCSASSSTTTVQVTEWHKTPEDGPCLLLCGGLPIIGGGIGNFHDISIRNELS
ncbi:Ig-like domain-containing protein [Kitasatospora cinereorecta]|uniref:Ig-like domain-containing protein n=1 Tax=unclassified Streptomyces TaxID=2593676 RepID=UPI0033783A7F